LAVRSLCPPFRTRPAPLVTQRTLRVVLRGIVETTTGVPLMRTTPLATGLALTVLLATGCAQESPDDDAATAEQDEESPQPTASPSVTVSTFLPPEEESGAITYDESAVPEGATAELGRASCREGGERAAVAGGAEKQVVP